MWKQKIIACVLLCCSCSQESFKGDGAVAKPDSSQSKPEADAVVKDQSIKPRRADGRTTTGSPTCKIKTDRSVLHPRTNMPATLLIEVNGAVEALAMDETQLPITGATMTVSPTSTKTYRAKVTGAGETSTCEVTIEVIPLEISTQITFERYASADRVGKLKFIYTLKNLASFEKVLASEFPTHTVDLAMDAPEISASKIPVGPKSKLFQQTFTVTTYYRSTGEVVAYQQQAQKVTLVDKQGHQYSADFGWIFFIGPPDQLSGVTLDAVPEERRFTGTGGSPHAKPVGPIVKN